MMTDSYETLKTKYEASQKAAGLAGLKSIERAHRIKWLEDDRDRLISLNRAMREGDFK